MPLRAGLTVKSAEAMVANFRTADAVAQRAFRRVVRERAEKVVRLVKVYVPVDTGFMRDHIRAELSPSGLQATYGWFASDFLSEGLPFYPPYVEFGTMRAPAQPSLYPALFISEAPFRAELRQVMLDSLARVGRRRR